MARERSETFSEKGCESKQKKSKPGSKPRPPLRSRSLNENSGGKEIDQGLVGEDELFYVSEKVFDWRRLLRYLYQAVPELSRKNVESEIDNLDQQKRDSKWTIQDVSRKALQVWKQAAGSSATSEILIKALEEIGRKDIKERLESSLNDCKDGTAAVRRTTYQRLVSYYVDLPAVDKIIDHIRNPNVRFISVAGGVGCGKSVLMDAIERKLSKDSDLTKLTPLKVSAHPRSTSRDLASKILTLLGAAFSEVTDNISLVKERLSYYADVLILDISLVPGHKPNDVPRFLYDLLHDERLSRLNFIVTSLASLKGSVIFQDTRRCLVEEVIIEEFPVDRAIGYIRNISPSAPKECLEFLCKHFERTPHVLKHLGRADLQDVLKVSGCNQFEVKKALETRESEFINSICKCEHLKENLKFLFTCLDSDSRILLTQCLVFRSAFTIEQAKIVSDSHLTISESTFHDISHFGIILAWSKDCEIGKQEPLFSFPKLYRHFLLHIIKDDLEYKTCYLNAELKYCKFYFELIDFLGSRFLGADPVAPKNVQMLASAVGVELQKDHCKIIKGCKSVYSFVSAMIFRRQGSSESESEDEQSSPGIVLFQKVKDTILLFREYEDEIVNCLQVAPNHSVLYDQTIKLTCGMPVLCLLNKLLILHQQLSIYEHIYRTANDRDDRLSMAQLDVSRAFFLMYAHGFQRFCPEAKRLLAGAKEVLETHKDTGNLKDVYANCLSKLGRCLATEGITNVKMSKKLIHEGIALMEQGIKVWKSKREKTVFECVLIAANYRHLAGVHHSRGRRDDLKKAEELLRDEVLPVYGSCLGKHPFLATGMNCLGVVLRKMNSKEESLENLRDAYKVRKELLGDHEDTARSLHALGVWHQEVEKDLPKAKKHLKKAAEMCLRAIGETEDTAGSFKELSKTCKKLGQIEEAEEFQKISEEIQKRCWRPCGNKKSQCKSSTKTKLNRKERRQVEMQAWFTTSLLGILGAVPLAYIVWESYQMYVCAG